MQKPGNPTTTINLGTNGAVTATQTSNAVNAGSYANAVAWLNISAISGSGATLTVVFQDSPDGVIWANVPSGAMTGQTATGVTRLALSGIGPKLRAVQTVAGTTPSITYDLKVSGDS